MTSHELARRLLELPDLPACFHEPVEYYHDSAVSIEIKNVEECTRTDYTRSGGYIETTNPIISIR